MYEALPTQPLEFSDFSGGKTDNYLKCRPNQFEEGDNLLITNDKRFYVRPGRLIWNETYYRVPNSDRVGSIISHNDDEVFFQSGPNFYWISSGWQTLLGPTSNPVFYNTGTGQYIDHTIWNRHLIVTNDGFNRPMKIYKDSGNVWRVRNAGLPDLSASPVCTPGTAGTTYSYLYRFCYEYTYTVGNVTFEDEGPMTEVAMTSLNAITTGAGNPTAISVIPPIINGSSNNWDTAVLKIFIFRTENGGTVFYKVGEVTNGTTTFSDSTTDAALVLNTPAYTNGDRLDNDPPPPSKFCVAANDCVWYGYTAEGTSYYPSRIRPSLPFDPDSCPSENFFDLQYDLTGLGFISIYPIAFCKSNIYRIEGRFDNLGQGSIQAKDISKTVGCVSSQSIVNTEFGVFFAGTDGFYYTDGYTVKRISDELNTTYKALISTAAKQKKIQGCYSAIEQRVYWTTKRDDSSQDNDALFVLDLRWGIESGGVFTTISGGGNYFPTAICYYNKQLLTGDVYGYSYYFDEDTTADPRVDVLIAPSLWERQTILYDYKGPATNFGISEQLKQVPTCTVTIQNQTNMGVAVQSNNNDRGAWVNLKEIRYFGNILWGDPSITWGSTVYSYLWDVNELIRAKRRFPAGNLKTEYKQMRFKNSKTNIYNSDVYGEGNLDANLKTLTIATETWADDIVDYYVSFESDSYVNEYLVTARTSNTKLTFSDPLVTCTVSDTSTKWVIRGYRKGDKFILMSYTLWWAGVGMTQTPFKDTQTGANA